MSDEMVQMGNIFGAMFVPLCNLHMAKIIMYRNTLPDFQEWTSLSDISDTLKNIKIPVTFFAEGDSPELSMYEKRTAYENWSSHIRSTNKRICELNVSVCKQLLEFIDSHGEHEEES
jgi:hypothetical protein